MRYSLFSLQLRSDSSMLFTMENERTYNIHQAAEALNLTLSGLRYHIYKTGAIEYFKRGRNIFFTQQMLDKFNQVFRRPASRPRKEIT